MSSTPALFRALVDDAAVFPPGNASLPDAVRTHREHRATADAAVVGPLLVPAGQHDDLLTVLEQQQANDVLEVGLIARPGSDVSALGVALEALSRVSGVRVVGAELGWQWDWRGLGLDGIPVALEIPRGPGHDAALVDVRTARGEGLPVLAKLRTGPTPTWPWPDEDELAAFLCVTAAAGLPFKLTGGLHHAVRGRYAVDGAPEDNHGVLNVLLATASSLEGAPREEVAALLAVRDGEALAALTSAWTDATAARVRERFTAYGCCTVTDPIGELTALGLLPTT
ncbi:MAG: hypothetical protein ABIQ61_03685 [Ornithinibacter sp.]